MPNTYAALLKAIIDATAFAHKAENRKQIAEAIAPANYLNQPVTVLEQILTGTYADGLGNVKRDPDRIDFDPFPWQSFAIWILTQMKRWGQIKGDIDYKAVAEQVYLATDTAKLMKEVGLTPPTASIEELQGHGQGRSIPPSPTTTSRASRSSERSHAPCPRSTHRRRVRAFRVVMRGRPRSIVCEQVDRRISPRDGTASPEDGRWPDGVRRCVAAPVRAVHRRVAPRHARQRARSPAWIRNTPSSWARPRARASRRCRARSTSAPSSGSTCKHPFYDNGPNDKGIGIQLAYSIARVTAGYLLAVAVAIPIGFLIGMSPLMSRALDPFIQVLKPISPLAWMPLALYTIKDSSLSSIFVIFICSLWPMLINTAFGVAAVRKEWLNVARTLEVGTFRRAFTIILPAAAPTILTGMRISIGIAWLVIVAAEMLVGGTGIGYFVWNEWNNLSITNVITAILVIGVVGMVLDQMLARATRLVTFPE